jgi:hypothetical protein
VPAGSGKCSWQTPVRLLRFRPFLSNMPQIPPKTALGDAVMSFNHVVVAIITVGLMPVSVQFRFLWAPKPRAGSFQKAPYGKSRRVPCSLFPLFIHIHRHTRLEFHGEFIFVDRDLFNQPPNKFLVVFGKSGGLFL